MKKIFTLFCMMLLAVQFAAAQKTLYVISKDGKLSAYSANKITFDNDLFTFTYGEVTEITQESFSVSLNVAFKSDEYKSFTQFPDVGICISDVNKNPTISDGKIDITRYSFNYEHSFKIYGLDAGTTYYYRAYVKVNDVVYYGDVRYVTTYGKKIAYNYKIINGHKFVDLGLPSGLLWATCNVGAVTAADDGCYFAWGETDMTTKSSYNWDTYKYGPSYSNLTKYNSTDGKTTLDKEDDAAYVNWGDSCRMPTDDDFNELLNSSNCTWTWTSMTISDDSSIYGYKVTSVKNGNSIFLPASGKRYNEFILLHNSSGYYWSCTLNSSSSSYACSLCSYNSGHNQSNDYRYHGNTVRPVAEP